MNRQEAKGDAETCKTQKKEENHLVLKTCNCTILPKNDLVPIW